ncbi:MAG TPA: hypothetical protein VIJ24_02250 [Verrucomicrobiae bacterium]|jgi:hypothetical protein
MNLDEVQKKKVAEWIAQGAKLSEIQNRVAAEFGLRLTYMDVRFLVDDLKLTPKDPEPPPKPIQPVAAAPAPADAAPMTAGAKPPAGGVSISLDKITKPGAIVSGQVTFSDGQPADWHLDETGRLGLAARQAGYRPSAADVQAFQTALQNELAKAGF